jgi:hypothetical protein
MCQHFVADNCLPAFFRLFGYQGYILPKQPYFLGPTDMKGISSKLVAALALSNTAAAASGNNKPKHI